MLFIWATYEDLFGEWMQVWCIVFTLVLSVRLASTRWRFRWFFALLSLACFYVAMEEISWGQRLIGFSSPEYFKANNLQNETNIHNFLTGPYGTTLKATLSYGLGAALAIYGLVYPLLLRLRVRAAGAIERLGLAAPPLYLWPYFLIAAYLETGPFRFNEGEIAELLVGIALMFTAVHYRAVRRAATQPNGHGQDPSDSDSNLVGIPTGRPALHMVIAMVMVLVLAAGTTIAVCSSPAGKNRINRRVYRGMEKFAGRYIRFEQYEAAAGLYHLALKRSPDKVSLVRRLATCYQGMGDEKRFGELLQKSLELDMARLEVKPKSTTTHRSLARTYRLMGNSETADELLRIAEKIGKRRLKKNRNSASAAYSLGKTYAMQERHGEALKSLSRAYKLNPTSRSYRKAYYRAKKKVPQD